MRVSLHQPQFFKAHPKFFVTQKYVTVIDWQGLIGYGINKKFFSSQFILLKLKKIFYTNTCSKNKK
jgi:hypothetical protein